jgi:hypothetical protein
MRRRSCCNMVSFVKPNRYKSYSLHLPYLLLLVKTRHKTVEGSDRFANKAVEVGPSASYELQLGQEQGTSESDPVKPPMIRPLY